VRDEEGCSGASTISICFPVRSFNCHVM
jgi:hypothetical protein